MFAADEFESCACDSVTNSLQAIIPTLWVGGADWALPQAPRAAVLRVTHPRFSEFTGHVMWRFGRQAAEAAATMCQLARSLVSQGRWAGHRS
jgi:hypothetical protein